MRKGTLYFVLVVLLTTCRDAGRKDGIAVPVARTLGLGDASAPVNSAVPYGLTWVVQFTENVSLSTLQSFATTLSSFSVTLWKVTEGQFYIQKVYLSDNAAPGATGNSADVPASLNGTDIAVFNLSPWGFTDGTLGYVRYLPAAGRQNRIMAIPSNADSDTLIHETGHVAFRISVFGGFGLTDEYLDGTQDVSCIMENVYSPLRFCSASNHVSQIVQPASCWTLLMTNYPALTYSGNDTVSTSPPTLQVEYGDAP